jgi:hypothetical protein
MNRHVNDDIVQACFHLADRAGAKDVEIGYLHDDVPTEQAGWYAQAAYQGARIITGDHASPTNAALALAQRLLTGATCRCRQPVTLTDDQPGCRWHLVGNRWEPGCDAPPLSVKGPRGDVLAMKAALGRPPNRAQRRAAKKRHR